MLQVNRSEVAQPTESRGLVGVGSEKGELSWRLYFSLRENGNEEIWTSNEVGFEGEVDMRKMIVYLCELRKIEDSLGESSSVSKESEKAYIEIFGSGFPMRTVDYPVSGKSIIEETVKVSRKQIDTSEFRPPAGYTKVPLEDMLQLGSGQ